MGKDSSMKAAMESGFKRRACKRNLAIFVAVVATNLVALCVYQALQSQVQKSEHGNRPVNLQKEMSNDHNQQQLEFLDATTDGFLDRRSEDLSPEFQHFIAPRKLPLGWNPALSSDTMVLNVGHGCVANKELLDKFMNYQVGGVCPDDDDLAQKLMGSGCEPLPRRRCLARIPIGFTEPHPFPECLWADVPDSNIHWSAYACKSFECLNTRRMREESKYADCVDCFDLGGKENFRWTKVTTGPLDFPIPQVLEMKNGGIRIGFDMGGGTATFAARMREYNVTIVTSTLDTGAPFNNFVSLRGLVSMHLSISQRVPFRDNTLDLVHSMHILSNWIPTDTLEFILYDIDRVLRPGGLFWLDHFFCMRPQLDSDYVPLINKLGYKRLKWVVGDKSDRGTEEVYLSAVLEKPTEARL
ncbi:unnamed protein product [Sphagnum jensenii]|uniref:Methyltransferase type 11 domain-containing protein n=1 Tax=Sphagnum jensenii TaxID=128206 RepID=A0ABP1B9N4_9BRYO